MASVEVRRSGQTDELVAAAFEALLTPLFQGKPTAAHADALGATLTKLNPTLGKRHVPVHVALPDPAVRLTVYEMDELPANRKTQSDLGQWLVKKERFAGEEPVCITQPLGMDGAKHLFLVGVVDAAWHACLLAALNSAGAVPWTINAAAIYRHNRFVADATTSPRDAACVALDADSWTLTVWDAVGRPRLIQSRWRTAASNELAEITQEVERTIVAFIHTGAGRAVKKVYALVTTPEEHELLAALNARLTEPCIPLTPDPMLADKRVANPTPAPYALALAAA